MMRPLWALVVLLCVLSPAPASLAGRKEPPVFDRTPPAAEARSLPATVAREVLAPRARPQYQLTEETEVVLDGRPCKYRDVPGNVSIIRMEVGPDEKTILKIHFRTRK
jgi:hypothetical protein